MKTRVFLLLILRLSKIVYSQFSGSITTVNMFDLTNPVTWKEMQNYYEETAIKEKSCYNCGFPEMGTVLHYQYHGENSFKPADINVQNLITKLIVIDLSSITRSNPNLVLTLKDARRWLAVEQGPFRPTLILFKFGWANHPSFQEDNKCFCHMPGISLDLASWIAVNMNHVVGVATDAPTLESEETRNATAKSVSVTALLAKSGVYMIENVDGRQRIPEKGCLAMVTPLKLVAESFVPARFHVFCPSRPKDKVEIILAARRT